MAEKWAVYSYDNSGAWNFGRLVKEDESPNPKYVKTFDNPVKMLAYFLVHQRKIVPTYNKRDLIKAFLFRFPEERNSLENLLAQSKPKCTRSRKHLLGPSDTWLESVGPGFQEYHR